MAINKKVQFLRNNSIYTGATGAAARTAAIAGMRGIATGSTTSGEIVDGQAILARYNAAGSASTGDVQTIYGIVHKGVNSKTGVTVYESSELLWAAINESVSTSTTISAGTGLSGGGQLNTATVTLRHKTATVNTLTDTDQTQIGTARTFTAVTGITDDGMGHMSSIKSAIFKLPDDVDSAVTQEQLTASTSHPIILKVDSGTSASANNKVYYSSGATVDKAGNIKTTGNVSGATISGANIYGATAISGANISAATAVRAGNVSAATISAATHVKAPTISGGSLTASGDIRGGNVSADTISAATHVKSATISGGSLTASGNIRGGNVSAATISAGTSIYSPSVSATTVSGGTIKGGTISGTSYDNLPTASSEREGVVKVVETTGTSSGSTVMSQKAVTEAISAALVDVADALVYKGTVSGQSASPGASLPKADKGDVYKVAVSGYVAGQKVEVGDMFICNTDNTASGTASTNWDVIQNNIDISDISTTSPLSGGGNVTSGPVTIAHKTITTNSVTGIDQTQITDNGTFDVVTSITTDGYGHPTQVSSTTFKLPADSKVTQEQFTGSTSNPIIIKVDSGTSASARNKVYFSSAATIDKTGNIKTSGNMSGATISGANIYGATAISGANISAATAVRAGNVSAATISAATHVKAPTISGGSLTASGDIRGGNVSAATISAATDLRAGNISAATISGGTFNGTNGEFSNYLFAESVCGGTNMSSPEIYGDYISGGTADIDGLVTASGFSATTSPSTASTDINASILLSNGQNTNIIDCGTY